MKSGIFPKYDAAVDEGFVLMHSVYGKVLIPAQDYVQYLFLRALQCEHVIIPVRWTSIWMGKISTKTF